MLAPLTRALEPHGDSRVAGDAGKNRARPNAEIGRVRNGAARRITRRDRDCRENREASQFHRASWSIIANFRLKAEATHLAPRAVTHGRG